jgi:hypothetical protein
MKKIGTLILLFFVFLCFTDAKAQIPNAGFETWISDSSAAGWLSEVDTVVLVPLKFKCAVKTTDKHSGASAIKLFPYHLIITAFATDTIIPGFATIGGINFNILTQRIEFIKGVPINARPTNITGWYKYTPVVGDTCNVLVYLRRKGNQIGYGRFQDKNTVSTYTQFNIPIIYDSASMPDTIDVVLLSSGTNAQLGSEFLVDDLAVVGGSGIMPLEALLPINIYPNPSTGSFNVELPYYIDVKIRIFDILGTEVFSTLSNNNLVSIDLSDKSKGLYFIEIDNGYNKQIKKISIIK